MKWFKKLFKKEEGEQSMKVTPTSNSEVVNPVASKPVISDEHKE